MGHVLAKKVLDDPRPRQKDQTKTGEGSLCSLPHASVKRAEQEPFEPHHSLVKELTQAKASAPV